MMYETLAHYYDMLVKDDEATQAWVSLITEHMRKGNILELACGSGEITIALAKLGYQVHATDLSADMIHEAQKKVGSEIVTWSCMDMCNIEDTHQYDGILCLCDSFNYILHKAQVHTFFQSIHEHLRVDGMFIMDMHAIDRLEEFREEYNEAGKLDHHDYQWTIYSEDDAIYQNFAFYDEVGNVTLEQHIQRVYDPNDIMQILKQTGFDVKVYTDFDKEGIVAGEKQFFICKKVKTC